MHLLFLNNIIKAYHLLLCLLIDIRLAKVELVNLNNTVELPASSFLTDNWPTE